MRFAALVLKNLLRNRRRTALTVVSIAISLLVFTLAFVWVGQRLGSLGLRRTS